MWKEGIPMINEMTTDYKMYYIQRKIIKLYNNHLLKSYDLSYQHYLVLMVLSEHDALPVLQLGEKLSFQSGTITPIIKKMEANGLISRVRSHMDERIVNVELTQKGKQLCSELTHIPEQLFQASELTKEEYEQLMKLTRKVVNNMNY